MAVKRFGSLDGLRCLSILAVLWHHSGVDIDFPLFHRGQLGVRLFFAISGFLITSLLIRERVRHGEVSLRKFYVRRSLRIFPLYYAILLTYVVVVAIVERDTAVGRAGSPRCITARFATPTASRARSSRRGRRSPVRERR